MVILGLDLALGSTGFCVVEVKGSDVSIKKIGSTNTTKIDGRGNKLRFIYEQMEFLRDNYKPDILVIERPFTRFHASTQAIFSSLGVTQMAFDNLEPIFIAAATVKKFVTGSGRATKEEVQGKLKDMFPEERFNNDDESDALGVVVSYLKEKGIL